MNTPITDAAAFDVDATNWDNSIKKTQWPNGDYVDASLARRLELDRAVFRQALIDIYLSPAADSRALANTALQAASKFEGEEHAP